MRFPLKVLVAMTLGLAAPYGPAQSADLTSYRWQQRLLLVFAAHPSDPDCMVFAKELSASRDALQDRDLVLGRIFEQGPSQLGARPLPPEDAQSLHRRFGIRPATFTVVLIGKDGGVKMKREGRVDLEAIFARIDAMPMRQQEMRARESAP
jgi:hypothetical protein